MHTHTPRQRVVYYKDNTGRVHGMDKETFFRHPALSERLTLVSIENLPIRQPGYDVDGNWRSITETKIVEHVINGGTRKGHLNFVSLTMCGIPAFDLEIISKKKFRATKIVKAICELLNRKDADIQKEIEKHKEDCVIGSDCLPCKSTTADYKNYLIKTLKYIEELGIGKIDWKEVEKIIPNARAMRFNLDLDTKDGTFFIYGAIVDQ
ncbi:MAG: hypothetical protein Q7S22_05540 [Candidatus Micrarchaeota archaeon]|nr:hypothetical protein [Candidatus Micrarchaeota archaeon]